MLLSGRRTGWGNLTGPSPGNIHILQKQSMRRWLRRFLYLAFFLLWLAVMFFPCMAFSLSMNQQLQVGASESSHIRVFLLQADENEGVGVEWQRPSSLRSPCYKTTVTYWMWAGTGENSTYCQCIDPQTGFSLSSTPQLCQ